MGIGQNIRRIGLKAKNVGSKLTGSVKRQKVEGAPGRDIKKLSKRALVGGAGFLALYYFGGAFLMNTVDDNINFKPQTATRPGTSAAVAMVVALIDREVGQHGWAANDPFFKPTAILDNMPNYQQGMVAALARFGFELTDQLGRTRGSSQADADLQEASGLLQYSGDKWFWDPSVSLLPTASSEQQYRKAARALKTYNDNLASGTATFERRSDNLLATLDRIALDLGSSSAAIDSHVSERAGFALNRTADDIYYSVKGQMYGYHMILRALGEDFAEVIAERSLQKPWAQMLASFEHAASQEPGIIMNGHPDAQAVPCHLCGQGFYLLRARTQLREITNILLK
jgi:hypothetical protein